MDIKEILSFIETKKIDINEKWHFHATAENIEFIKRKNEIFERHNIIYKRNR